MCSSFVELESDDVGLTKVIWNWGTGEAAVTEPLE